MRQGGEVWGKSTKWEPRRDKKENPKYKSCPKIPPQGQPRSRSQLPPRAHKLHIGRNCHWAKSKGPGLGSTGPARGPQTPRPAPQHFLLRIQDNGQGRVGSSCIHHTNAPGLFCWGTPVKYLRVYWGRKKGWGLPQEETGMSGPQPGASAMASTALGKVPGWSPGMWVT